MLSLRRLQLTLAVTIFTSISRTKAHTYETRFPGVTWDDERWVISNINLDQGHYASRMSLANGYLGINVASVGPFFEVDEEVNGDNINGWPLFQRRQTFGTIAGFYDSQPTTNSTNFPWLSQYGWESVISGVPHWAGLVVEAQGHVLDASVDPSQISDFRSVLDIRAGGLLIWQYTWTPPNSDPIDIEYDMFVHKLYINQAAVRLRMTAAQDMNVTVVDVLQGDCAVRTDSIGTGFESDSPSIWTAVSPLGLSDTTAYIYSTLAGDESTDLSLRTRVTDKSMIGGNSSSIAQSVVVSMTAGLTATIEKHVGGASKDHNDDPQGVARNASMSGAASGFPKLQESHSQEWQSIMTKDSVDDFSNPDGSPLTDENLIELQITAVTNPFQLLQNTIGTNAVTSAPDSQMLDSNSIAVGGLGSDSYAGQIFWDADVWMAPGLVIAHPQAAKQIALKRQAQYAQAKENIKTAYQSSQNLAKFNSSSAIFPWTTGRWGNCTSVGPCFDYEYHINGDIGLELYNYLSATGDWELFRTDLWPIHKSIAQLYSDLLSWNSTKQKWELHNATDPDEYANHVSNPGFTMPLILTHLRTANSLGEQLGEPTNHEWLDQANNTFIPLNTEGNIILEYEDMNGFIAVKQADVVLIDDFLDYPNEYSLADLDYYARRQSANGPGMTYGVFSVVANEVSPSGCSSYTYDLYSTGPYLRGPWFQYSEQLNDNYSTNGGTHPAYPFLTASGGAYRIAMFGYLGLRLQVGALNIDPSLPPQIQHVNYRTFYWQGHKINATSNSTHTTLTRIPGSLSTANQTYMNQGIPVTVRYNQNHTLLPVNGTLIIENRRAGYTKTVANNIAQCQSASSTQPTQPGQMAIAAIDGAISTKWQPSAANEWSSVTVKFNDTTPKPITGIFFDWAQEPPTAYNVIFHNGTDPMADAAVNVTHSNNITLSAPFNYAAQADVMAYTSNSTNVTLIEPVWSGKFATLYIFGNQNLTSGETTPGATVAEWAIIAENGTVPEVKLGNTTSRYDNDKFKQYKDHKGKPIRIKTIGDEHSKLASSLVH